MSDHKTLKAFVLSSGGLDSSVCVGHAVKEYGAENVTTASLYYGQKHAKELQCAKDIADYYKVNHIELDISQVFQYAGNICSLMQDSAVEMIDKSYAEQIAESGKPNTEVPMRNGIFLLVAASIAMSIYPDDTVVLIYGAHSDDAAGSAYPDCSVEFADTADRLIRIGSREHVFLSRPLLQLNKAEVVARGIELNVPFHLTTSCYKGGDKACGVCGTCRDRLKAFEANGIKDPIEYEEN